MAITTKTIIPLAIIGALVCLPVLSETANAMSVKHLAPHHKRHPYYARSQEQEPQAGNTLKYVIPEGTDRAPFQAHHNGDTSGFPGGNEFDPSAPFGGQAAVTAPAGTDAYEEQMNQRRYFCEADSNRC